MYDELGVLCGGTSGEWKMYSDQGYEETFTAKGTFEMNHKRSPHSLLSLEDRMAQMAEAGPEG